MRRRPKRSLDQHLDGHPSVVAWRTVHPHGALQTRIDVYSESSNWLLCALVGAGPAGSTVFAKRRVASTARTERTVYERILPSLPIATPRCYGCHEDDGFVWFLLEAVKGEPYDARNPQHLAMAGAFVATMHTHSAPLMEDAHLPEAGSARYLAHLVSGRERLRHGMTTSRALDSAGRSILEQVVERLDRVEAGWPLLHARCLDAPVTLVHADFRPKNVFVRHDKAGLVAFDWETAGWGPPAPDLTRIDLGAYWQTARHRWGSVSFETVRAWAEVGHLFQTLAAIDWESTKLALETAEAVGTAVVSLDAMGSRLVEVSASR